MRVVAIVMSILLLSGCSGLPRPREMGDMALVRTVGVDCAGEDYALTVSTGRRPTAQQGDEKGALTLSATQDSINGAVVQLHTKAEDFVFFGYVDQLLVGEELAQQGIVPVLDYFAHDAELSLGAQIWLARKATAKQAVASGGEQGVDKRLASLRMGSEMHTGGMTQTAGEVYSNLLELGSALLPAVTCCTQEDEILGLGGYAVITRDGVAGYLDGETAKGLELLAGKPAADVLRVQLSQDNSAVVRINSAKISQTFSREGQTLRLSCKIEGDITEYESPPTQAEIERAQALAADRAQVRMEQTLAQLQQWQSDCLGLGVRAGLRAPRVWSTLAENWTQKFAHIETQVQVQAQLRIQ